MREFRIIAAVVLILLVVVVVAFVWSLGPGGKGRMETTAAQRIELLCGFKAVCKVRLGDLFGGDWDTLYEFGVGVPQSAVNQTLGTDRVKVEDMKRTLVLTRDGRVVASEHQRYGVEQPLDGQVEFADEHHREQSWVKYGRDTWLWVRTFHTEAAQGHGTYYVLSVEDPSLGS
jgi:hypothetical protein